MPLVPSFPDGGTGISRYSIGNIIKKKLQTTWDVTKTGTSVVRYDATKKDVFFDSSNQDFPANKAMNRPVVIRVQSSRTLHSDLEIGMVQIRYQSRPVIHVYAYDVQATVDGQISDLLEDVVMYVKQWISEDPRRFQIDGIHSVVGLEDNYIPNNGDPNWHHWMFVLEVEYEMRREPDEPDEFDPDEFIPDEFE